MQIAVKRFQSFIAPLILAMMAAPPAIGAETCAKTSWYVGDYSICASSVLASQGKSKYGPENLSEHSTMKQAWCEGIKGPGIGQTITLKLAKNAPEISLLEIANGYQKSDQTYRENGRMKDVKITSDLGLIGNFSLDDSGFNDVEFSGTASFNWIRIEILSVYPGSKWDDTCVTGIGMR